ncbi:2OG-Fe dioxygenase family protein [Streptomyces sp. NPDC050564]|uniref:2OG-Fe dioxygenase family protein n=1 Tax=Streptomyces sp. NPDC050564 TaxID=3365631 RepID=UPI0037AD5037
MGPEEFRTGLNNAREVIEKGGLVLVTGADLMAVRDIGLDFPVFAGVWPGLPVDPYYVGDRPSRFRRHAQFDFDADAGAIHWRRSTGYFQAIEFNPLFGGMVRHFAPIERYGAVERVLTRLVRIMSREVFELSGRWLINVHLVRIAGDPDSAASPAPEGPHRDGYDFISLHLVGRDNDSGGETIILDKSDRRLFALTLNAPLDTLCMDDRQFRHYVTPISAKDRHCRRDMILISYQATGSDYPLSVFE